MLEYQPKFICMKICYFTLILLLGFQNNYSQKPIAEIKDFKTWRSVDNPVLSGDGKYFFYKINNEPYDGYSLVVRSTRNDWQMKLPGINNAFLLGTVVSLSLLLMRIVFAFSLWVPHQRSL